MIPCGSSLLDELQTDSLGRLGVDGGQGLWGKLGRGIGAAGDGVAQEDRRAQRGDLVEVAVDDHFALQHHPAQLRVGLRRLDLQCCAGVAFEVAHLL